MLEENNAYNVTTLNHFKLRDGKRVLDCLKKGVKIASQCMDPGTKAQLYTELLNKYIFFYEKGHTGITEEILQELIKRVQVKKICYYSTCSNIL